MYLFADIIIPSPLNQLFTYSVPQTMTNIEIGMRVLVKFGTRHFYTGIIANLHNNQPAYKLKDIEKAIDNHPIVLPTQLALWQQIAHYYRAPIGDVYKVATPTALRLESESILVYNETAAEGKIFNATEFLLCDTLKKSNGITADKLNTLCGGKCVSTIQHLIDNNIFTISEELQTTYKEKLRSYLLPNFPFTEEGIQEAENKIGTRSNKQLQLFRTFIELAKDANDYSVDKIKLQNVTNSTSAIVNQLIAKGLLLQEERPIGRISNYTKALEQSHQLSEAQEKARTEIIEQWKQHSTVLLHGVTSSGKTEIYVKLIEEIIAQGKQALLLVPEIALTTQLAARLQKVFGSQLGIYHSKYSNNERVEIYNNVLANKYSVILGTRSSVFLPFQNLGLVIIDEEHDSSYKQVDPSPRYHARSAALFLCQIHKCKALLGSATPSIESYCATLSNKFGKVELMQRHAGIELPSITCIDMQAAYKNGNVKKHFSLQLRDAITETLNNGKQVILFQNRRGYAPFMDCNLCGWVPKCKHCDVSLTYHKYGNYLRCHYCGYTIGVPKECPVCHNPRLHFHGMGTEQIEEDVQNLFPQARIARMDLDTTRGANASAQLIARFEAGELDILIGTQMVTKGLDFANVSLVGILNADNLFNYPDFRASERAFQLLTQVSGRAGRKGAQGRVILQTSMPSHNIIQYVRNNNYNNFFYSMMEERKLFNYPPYCRLIRITLKHHNEQTLVQASTLLADELKKGMETSVFGPIAPVVSRTFNRFIREILIKIAPQFGFENAKTIVDNAINIVSQQKGCKSLIFSIDVDPE